MPSEMIIVFFFASVFLSCLPFLHSSTDTNTTRSICPESFSCPNLAPFKYPFYNATNMECGLIQVNCSWNSSKIQLGEDSYEIRGKLGSESTILIHNRTFERLVNKANCSALMDNFTSPSPLLYSMSIQPFITLYKCKKNPNDTPQTKAYFYYKNSISDPTVASDLLPSTCDVIRLPATVQSRDGPQVHNESNIFSLLNSVFTISFNLSSSCDECHNKDGRCETCDGHFQCIDAKKGIYIFFLLSFFFILGTLELICLTSS